MKLLHFAKGTDEYIVLTDSNDDPDDWRRPDYEFVTVCDVEFSNFTEGNLTGLPLDTDLSNN